MGSGTPRKYLVKQLIENHYLIGMPAMYRHNWEILGLATSFDVAAEAYATIGENWDDAVAAIRHPAIHASGLVGVVGSDFPFFLNDGPLPDWFRFTMRRYWGFVNGSMAFSDPPAPFQIMSFLAKPFGSPLTFNNQTADVQSLGALGLDNLNPIPDIPFDIIQFESLVPPGPYGVYDYNSTSTSLQTQVSGISADRFIDLALNAGQHTTYPSAIVNPWTPLPAGVTAHEWSMGPSAPQFPVIGSEKLVVSIAGNQYEWAVGGSEIYSGIAPALPAEYMQLVDGSDNRLWASVILGGVNAVTDDAYDQIDGVLQPNLVITESYFDLCFAYFTFNEPDPSALIPSETANYKKATGKYNYYNPKWEAFKNSPASAGTGFRQGERLIPNFYTTMCWTRDNDGHPVFPFPNFRPGGAPTTRWPIGQQTYEKYSTYHSNVNVGLPIHFDLLRATPGSNNYLDRVANLMPTMDTMPEADLKEQYAFNVHIGIPYNYRRPQPNGSLPNVMEFMNSAGDEIFPYQIELQLECVSPPPPDPSTGDIGVSPYDTLGGFLWAAGWGAAAEPKEGKNEGNIIDMFTYEIMKANIFQFQDNDVWAPDVPSDFPLYSELSFTTVTDPSTVPSAGGHQITGMVTGSAPYTNPLTIRGSWLSHYNELDNLKIQQPNVEDPRIYRCIDIANMFANGAERRSSQLPFGDDDAPSKFNCFLGQTDIGLIGKWKQTPPIGHMPGRDINSHSLFAAGAMSSADFVNFYPEWLENIPTGPLAGMDSEAIVNYVIATIATWSLRHIRTYEEIIGGKMGITDPLCYKIDKYEYDMSTETLGDYVQSIYVPHVGPGTPASGGGIDPIFKYIDTQVFFNKAYYYKVSCYSIGIGNQYSYRDPAVVNPPQPNPWPHRLWPILFGDRMDRHTTLAGLPTPVFGQNAPGQLGLNFLAGVEGDYTPGLHNPHVVSPPDPADEWGVSNQYLLSSERTYYPCINKNNPFLGTGIYLDSDGDGIPDVDEVSDPYPQYHDDYGDMNVQAQQANAYSGGGTHAGGGSGMSTQYTVYGAAQTEKRNQTSMASYYDTDEGTYGHHATGTDDAGSTQQFPATTAEPFESTYADPDKGPDFVVKKKEPPCVTNAFYIPPNDILDKSYPLMFDLKVTGPPAGAVGSPPLPGHAYEITVPITMDIGYLPVATYGENMMDADKFAEELERQLNDAIDLYYAEPFDDVLFPGDPPGVGLTTLERRANYFTVRVLPYGGSPPDPLAMDPTASTPNDKCRFVIVRNQALHWWWQNGFGNNAGTDGGMPFMNMLAAFGQSSVGCDCSSASKQWPTYYNLQANYGGTFTDTSAPGYSSYAATLRENFKTFFDIGGQLSTNPLDEINMCDVRFMSYDGMHGYSPAPHLNWDESIVAEALGSVTVDNFSCLKIIEMPYTTIGPVLVTDLPPVYPNTEFFPLVGNATKMKILFAQPHYQKTLMPIGINDGDMAAFDAIRAAQGRPADGPILFGSDDTHIKFQVFRVDQVPTSYNDFAGHMIESLDTVTEGGYDIESATFLDSIEPNKEYYYCFRTEDKNGYLSVPTPVTKVMMVNDNGRIFPVIENYQMKSLVSRSMKIPFRRYLEIDTSFQEADIDTTGLTSAGDPLTAPVGISVGENLFTPPGAPVENKVKIRITSKDTAKKIDLNLNFKMESIPNPKIEDI